MTKEEAIKKLQKHKDEYLDKWVDFSGITEAIDMAIQALKENNYVEEVGCNCDNCKLYLNAKESEEEE